MIEIKRSTQRPAQTAQERPQQPASVQAIDSTPEAQSALKRPFATFDGINYRTVYRDIFDFHEKHNPPRIDNDNGLGYWEETNADLVRLSEKYEDNAFVNAILIAVHAELERQSQQIASCK